MATAPLASAPSAFRGFGSVLCPVDFSSPSQLALRYAEAIALRSDAKLTVAYVNDPLLIAAAAAALHDRHIARRSVKELRDFTAATLAAASPDRLNLKFRVNVGEPSDEILVGASRTRADLIVLGTHGLTGAQRLLVGSTTMGVLRRTAIPVLAIPSRSPSGVIEAPGPSWPAGRILAPVQLGAGASKEVDTAAQLAAWLGRPLLLLHVVDRVAAPDWLKGSLDAHERIQVGHARTALERLARSAARRVPVETRVVCGRPADEIAAVAATEHIGLIVVALQDRRGWFATRRGSIAYHVLSHEAAPVLAYPQPWRPR